MKPQKGIDAEVPLPHREDESPFAGIDRTTGESLMYAEPEPLTCESLDKMAERMRNFVPEPMPEFHHPRCPKYLTQGKKACRCGTSPFEGVFEDELERMKKNGD